MLRLQYSISVDDAYQASFINWVRDQKNDICSFKKTKLIIALHNYVTNKGQLTRPSALSTTSPERVLAAILFNGMNV